MDEDTPSAEQTAPSRDRHVIVTGCLSLAPAKAGAPTGTAGTSGTADAAAPEATVGRAGTARATDDAATEPASTLPTFLVTIASVSPADAPHGENNSEKVEVTGTLEEQNASPAASVPIVHLESGKTLAPVCGPGA